MFERAKSQGASVTQLEYEEIENPLCARIWQWFCELNSGRQSNGMGANMLAWTEIKSWCELTDNWPTPFEINVIKQLDSEFVKSCNKKKDK